MSINQTLSDQLQASMRLFSLLSRVGSSTLKSVHDQGEAEVVAVVDVEVSDHCHGLMDSSRLFSNSEFSCQLQKPSKLSRESLKISLDLVLVELGRTVVVGFFRGVVVVTL